MDCTRESIEPPGTPFISRQEILRRIAGLEIEATVTQGVRRLSMSILDSYREIPMSEKKRNA